MSLILLGPATITHDSVDIGKTHGGGTLQLNYIERNDIGDYKKEVLTHVTGEIKLKEISSNITLDNAVDSNIVYGYGEVIFDFISGTIKLYNCKLTIAESFSFGTFSQQPLMLNLLAKPDNSNNIIQLGENP